MLVLGLDRKSQLYKMHMDLLQFIIGSSAITTAIIFIAKFVIKWMGDAGLERYKSELQQETFKFQSALEKDLESYRIRFSRLHLEQVEVVKNLYSKLIKAENPLEYLTRSVKWSNGKTEEENAKEVIENSNEFFRYFEENEIILNEETCHLIITIRTKILEVWNTYSNKKFAMDNSIRGKELVELVKSMRDAYDKILLGEIQELKKELKRDFRQKLGVMEK